MTNQVTMETFGEVTITYIQIDETHRIELMPSGNYYPQYLTSMYLSGEGPKFYAYYKKGNKQRSFRSEKGARNFLDKQIEQYAMLLK